MNAIVIMTGLLVFLTATGYAGSIDYSYWNRAIVIAERESLPLPSEIRVTEQVTDDAGKPVETSVTHIRVTRSDSGAPDLSLVSRQENGKDQTERFKKAFPDHKPDVLETIEAGGLFERQAFSAIRFTGMILDSSEAVYHFTAEAEAIPLTGTVRVDIRTGCAVYSRVAADQIPSGHVSDKNVVLANYVETLIFSNDPNAWFPRKSTETMDIRITGHFSSFNGRIRTETVISPTGLSPFTHPDSQDGGAQ